MWLGHLWFLLHQSVISDNMLRLLMVNVMPISANVLCRTLSPRQGGGYGSSSRKKLKKLVQENYIHINRSKREGPLSRIPLQRTQ